MPFRPEQFHEVAKNLKERIPPRGEGRDRTIAGRAYYSAYLATCEAIKRRHPAGDNRQRPSHDQVCDGLSRVRGDDEVAVLGNLLSGLKTNRVHADYTLPTTLSEDTADQCVVDAKAVLDLLAKDEVVARLPLIQGDFRR